LLIVPVAARAVSLGEIDVRSALNQPLAAEIALTATAEELEGLTISLASSETFSRYGLDRPQFLTSLEFRIGIHPGGGRAVFVTSRQAIAEPFVELLIEASSRSGRFLRQYTLFLDPPTLLPPNAVPAPIEPAQTRVPEPGAGEIHRPAPVREPEAEQAPSPSESRTPVREPEAVVAPPAPSTTTTSAAPPAPLPGTYGEVQRGETLWGIATTLRPSGVTMNQMMVAIYEANPQAFNANMNILRRGAILRIPELSEIQALDARAATSEAQRQTDAWQGRVADSEPRLILVPPSDDISVAALDTGNADSTDAEDVSALDEPSPSTEVAPGDRLVNIEDSELAELQDGVGAGAEEAVPAAGADPGVELESEQVFADEPVAAEDTPAPAPAQTAPAVTPRQTPAARVESEPALLDTILGWVAMPIVWIGAGAVVVVVGLLLFLRGRGRAEPEDVTGKWEALEAELGDDVAREATARLRRQAQDEDFVVQEQPAEPEPEEAAPAAAPKKTRASATGAATAKEPELADQTLSSQTVINLDQADPIAEADFHMAYGLYDQAAELVSKAVQAQPKRRDLKLKLLEVFFVWGNKESFLKTAKTLREEIGSRPDADWDKVVIMGKQICPDEPLFAAATAAAAQVDVDLDAGNAPALDLSFDADEGAAAEGGVDLDLAAQGDLSPTRSGGRAQSKPAKPAAKSAGSLNVDLDIGARTQAGLEAALLSLDDKGAQTTPDLEDALAATQESPTGETPRSGFDDWSAITVESPAVESDGGTVEQPVLSESPTIETPTVESTRLRGRKSAESSGEFTAELNLDDLGLDVNDIKNLPQDFGSSSDDEGDTREQQQQVGLDSDLLSATGVTQVLHEDDAEIEHASTAILSDGDATMLAPGFEGDGTVRTEVIERPIETMAPPEGKSDLDLDLDDFSAALHGGDTVEQPHAASFDTGIFQTASSTPIDLDIGADVRGDDDPTGTEEVGSVDPQTLTEVGTKLDLARAYIDMGDPEGARSILEEVLGEGDPGQRREAQTLIDALPA
jgi:pilus assembly protein FimV